MDDELREILTTGHEAFRGRPLGPASAGRVVADRPLPDLPFERRDQVAEAIREWGDALLDLLSSGRSMEG